MTFDERLIFWIAVSGTFGVFAYFCGWHYGEYVMALLFAYCTGAYVVRNATNL